MPTVVDIKTKKFGTTDRAWRLFPGVGYRHYEVMLEYNRVFLDYPHLPFPGTAEVSQDNYAISDLAKSMALAPIAFSRSDSIDERLRETNQGDYSRSRWTQRRRLALGWIRGLYQTAKVGDIVVVPGPGYRRNEEGEYELRPTLIGEIVGETERWTEEGPKEYVDARLLTRRVRWFRGATEDQLSVRTVNLLRTQNALVAMPRDELEGVLGAAYKNVVTETETLARFTTTNRDFRSYDALQFLVFVQGVSAAIRTAREGGHLADSSIFEIAGRMERDERYVVEQDANIHSPGYSTLKIAFDAAAATAKNAPLVIAVLFALATTPGAQPFDEDGQANVNLTNTESAALDPCDEEFGLEDDVRDTLNVIGLDRWRNEFCPVARAAQDHEGFRSIATVPDLGGE